MRGLALRICLIVAAALALMVAVGFLVFSLRVRDFPGAGQPLPMPGQVAAIVELVEATPPDKLPGLLRALNSSFVKVDVVAAPPGSEGTVSMPLLTRLVRNYLKELGGRPVNAMVDVGDDAPANAVSLRGGRLWATNPIRLVVGLRDGRTLVVEFRNAFLTRFTGFRLAFAVLVVTLVIGAASLWAVQRQIRPIEKLAETIDQFGVRLDLPLMREGGASEVRRLIATVNRMQGRIRDLIEGRTRMMAAIGHDLGTYLTRLRLRAEFIVDDAQRARAVRDIDDMSALMSDTLTLAKMENDGEPRDTIDLAVLARRQAESVASQDATVRLHVPDAPVFIHARESAINRAIANLISNALKYGGEADVTVVRGASVALLRVDDRGPGIPAHEREAVLEPFYRQDAARNLDAGGFGLGLAIVADIVRRHKGRIKLGDRPGGGLSAEIELPLAGEDQATSI